MCRFDDIEKLSAEREQLLAERALLQAIAEAAERLLDSFGAKAIFSPSCDDLRAALAAWKELK